MVHLKKGDIVEFTEETRRKFIASNPLERFMRPMIEYQPGEPEFFYSLAERISRKEYLDEARQREQRRAEKRQQSVLNLATSHWIVDEVSKNGMVFIIPDTSNGMMIVAYGRWILPSNVVKVGEQAPDTPLVLGIGKKDPDKPEWEARLPVEPAKRLRKEIFKQRRPVRVRPYRRRR